MKEAKELQSKMNELIAFAEAETAEDHACFAAMLLSVGAVFSLHGGMTREDVDYVINTGLQIGHEEAATRPGGPVSSVTLGRPKNRAQT